MHTYTCRAAARAPPFLHSAYRQKEVQIRGKQLAKLIELNCDVDNIDSFFLSELGRMLVCVTDFVLRLTALGQLLRETSKRG